MNIQYHGHSCIQITCHGHSLIIDPFISGNTQAVTKVEDIHVQHILLSHGHLDHTLDALTIAKNNAASIVAVEELALHYEKQGALIEMMHVGGALKLDSFDVHLTNAVHSSSVSADQGQVVYMGESVGFVIKIGGFTLYHAGDTALFGDMKLIGEQFDIDFAFLPIGGRFTMNPEDALTAASWLKARHVFPIHYNTFPPILQDGVAFVKKIHDMGMKGTALAVGETVEF